MSNFADSMIETGILETDASYYVIKCLNATCPHCNNIVDFYNTQFGDKYKEQRKREYWILDVKIQLECNECRKKFLVTKVYINGVVL
jgi:ribosomal protein L33